MDLNCVLVKVWLEFIAIVRFMDYFVENKTVKVDAVAILKCI